MRKIAHSLLGRVALTLIAMALVFANARAEFIRARVTYVSESVIYINAGSLQGIAPGQKGDLQRNASHVSSVAVVFVAEHSASCRLLEQADDVQIGDAVFFQTQARLPIPVVALPSTANFSSASSSGTSVKFSHLNRWTGRLAWQSDIVRDHSSIAQSRVQPSVVLNSSLENVAGTGSTLAFRLRSRKVVGTTVTNGRQPGQWDHRIYELSLVNSSPESRFHYALGRAHSNDLNGIGDFDGAVLSYGEPKGIRVGAYGGTQPDPITTRVNTDATKGGLLAVYSTGQGTMHQFSTTLALSGEYYRHTISREFVYEQSNIVTGRALAFYQSAEVNVNRGWKLKAEGKSFELTNLLVNLCLTPVNALTTTIGYDNRTNYRTYETKSLADSLFDNRNQQGLRVGLDARLPWSVDLNASGSARSDGGGAIDSRNTSFSLAARDLLGTRIMFVARYSTFGNLTSNGSQPSAGLSRNLFSSLDLDVQAGQDTYDFGLYGTKTTSRWLKTNLNWMIARWLYTSVYAEIYRNSNVEPDRYFTELGVRF